MYSGRGGAGSAFLLLAAAAFPLACSSEEPTAPQKTPVAIQALPSEHSVARYLVKVDPLAAEPVVIEPIEEAAAAPHMPGMRTQTTSELATGQTVLLGKTPQVTVTGPGTYDQATHTMSAPVIIKHDDPAASDFDELQMVVTDIKSSGTVQFVTSNNGNTGIGAVIAMTDIQGANSTSSPGCGTVKQQSAFHALRIVDPTDAKFTFAIDVRANAGSGSAISPDCDSDGYNAEVGQDAGNDCNNGNGSISPATTATCACSTSSCTTGGASCSLTPISSGTVPCNGTVSSNPTSCICDFNAGSTLHDVTANCSKSCTFECNGVADTVESPTDNTDACTSTCSGGTCTYSCSNLDGADCSYYCGGGTSTCNLSCNNANASTDCQYIQCTGSATCKSSCPGGAGACGTATCNKSNCTVDCGTSAASSFAGSCGISNQCNTSATCSVSCSGTGTGLCGVAKCQASTCGVTCGSSTEGEANFGDYCGIGDCRNGAACSVTCTDSPDCYLLCTGGGNGVRAGSCSMDCSALSLADQDSAKCNLDCRTPFHKVSLGNGLYECQQ